MPQMAPLNWLSLFILTIFIFMIINSLNYFTFKMTSSQDNIKTLKNKNWKW